MSKPQHRTPEHRAARKAIDQAQARGEVLWCVEPVCVMGSRDIQPWQRADVCHDPSGAVITGPGHFKCNRREGATRGNRMRGKAPTVHRWVL